mmetsp:Transcript_46348/g.147986  ORF Transcript_46348/g.147986 Transcript_46348/m.147986 type:complete len:222 (-) Transcript_46348:11-676(-)
MPRVLLFTCVPRYWTVSLNMFFKYWASATTMSTELSGASRSWLCRLRMSSICTARRSLAKAIWKPPSCVGRETPKPTLAGPRTLSWSKQALKPPGAQPRSRKHGRGATPGGTALLAHCRTSKLRLVKSRWSKISCMTPKDLWKCTSVSEPLGQYSSWAWAACCGYRCGASGLAAGPDRRWRCGHSRCAACRRAWRIAGLACASPWRAGRACARGGDLWTKP